MRAAARTQTGREIIGVTVFLGVMAVGLSGCNNDPDQAVIVAPSVTTVSNGAAVSGSLTQGAPDEVSPPPGTGAAPDTIPEVGVPGLGTDDAFCAAWSEWAGSQQVILVSANFSDPAQVPSLEVISSPTLVGAYDTMLANWPPEIADARDVGANDYFGPAYKRAGLALSALQQAGADPATIDAIRTAWYQGLEQRDPTTPEFTVDLPDETWTLVDVAAQSFAAQVAPRQSDTSLRVTANTDAIDSYIVGACPDQGTLAGLEVSAGG